MLKTTILTTSGKSKSEIQLPAEVFGAKVNPALMAQAVRIYLANQREGSASTKTRAENSRTKAKWFRQKGTGRARHGSRSAPIFVGGGISHGPRPKDWQLKFPIKMKRRALASALTQRFNDKEIIFVETPSETDFKTKAVTQILKDLGLAGTKVSWVMGAANSVLGKAARNIDKVSVRVASDIGVYDVLLSEKLLMQEDCIATLAKRLTPAKPTKTPKPKTPNSTTK